MTKTTENLAIGALVFAVSATRRRDVITADAFGGGAESRSFMQPPAIGASFGSFVQPEKPFPTRQRTQQKASVTLNLFGFSFDNDIEVFNNDEEELEVVRELPSWVRGLLQWTARSEEEENEEKQLAASSDATSPAAADAESNGDLIRGPLANLVNVEALLLATGDDDDIDQLWRSPLSMDLQSFDIREEAALSTQLSSTENIQDQQRLEPLLIPSLRELGYFDGLVQQLQQQITDLLLSSSTSETLIDHRKDSKSTQIDTQNQDASADPLTSEGFSLAAEAVLREATSRIEFFLNEASSVMSPSRVENLILRAGTALTALETAAGAGYQGIAFRNAALQTTQYTADFVRMANGVLGQGYVRDDTYPAPSKPTSSSSFINGDDVTTTSPTSFGGALFQNFPNVRLIQMKPNLSPPSQPGISVSTADNTSPFTPEYRRTVLTAAEMANLAGAIYERTVEKVHSVDHAFVAQGKTAEVAWMITDSVGYEDDYRDVSDSDGRIAPDHLTDRFNFAVGPTLTNNAKDMPSSTTSSRKPLLLRTITIRGYDASDDTVDREGLLESTCMAYAEPIADGLSAPHGLLQIARTLYDELKPFILGGLSTPTHKVVFNGHSIGGSLAVLFLILLTNDVGADWVIENVLRVFTFGSPPVVVTTTSDGAVTKPQPWEQSFSKPPVSDDEYNCSILNTVGLPASIVYSYVQPWDPIPRLFSEIDPLYPLLGDLGEDGKTIYASGPSRTLRPITRAIIEVWDGWPRFRDNFRAYANQKYRNVGIVHMLLPDRLRYLTDRLVSVNVGVPPIDCLLRVPSDELYSLMEDAFPLDTFQISFVPNAVRGFVHHFFPAYDPSMNEFAVRTKFQLLQKERAIPSVDTSESKTKNPSLVNGARPKMTTV